MKKGQMSAIVVIVGVFLFIGGLFFALYHEPSNDFQQIPITEKDMLPVYEFVQQCLQTTTYKLLQVAALQGGYLETDDLFVTNNPIQSDGIAMPGNVVVPYWYYLDNHNVLRSLRKPLEGKDSLKEDLERVLPVVLPSCFQNFEDFQNLVVQYQPPKVELVFKEKEVFMHLFMKTRITKIPEGKESTINEYYATLSLPFKEMYDLAGKILDAEQTSHFLEQHILNLISLYSGLDAPLPPMAHHELGTNRFRSWIRSEVERVLKEDILPLVRMLQVVNTLSFHPIVLEDYTSHEGAIAQGIYNTMAIQIAGNKSFYDYIVTFDYPQSPIFLKIGNGEMIMPKSLLPIKNFLFDALGLSIYDYAFDYDLSFPVVVTLTKKDVWQKKDFTFSFALEANIRNNVPVTNAMEIQEQGNEITGLFFDDPSYFSEKEVMLTAVDAITQQPLGASITYDCGMRARLGITPLKTRLPYCMFNGEIIAEAEGYFPLTLPFNYDDRGDNLTLQLWPYHTLRVVPLVVNVSHTRPLPPRAYLSLGKPLPQKYQLFVSLQRIQDSPEEPPVPLEGALQFHVDEQTLQGLYQASVQELQQQDPSLVDVNFTLSFSQEQSFSLVPGRYRFMIFALLQKNITLPETEKTICPCGKILNQCVCKEETITYPEQSFAVLPLTSYNGTITISPQQLYSSKELVVFVPEKSFPRTWEDMERFLQNDIPLQLLPVLR